MIGYSDDSICQTFEYQCSDYETRNVSVSIPGGFYGKPTMIYLGLSGFYSAYLGLRSSYSSTQLQVTPRSRAFIPYDSCQPISTLTDVTDVQDKYLPIDAFATQANWKLNFNLTEINQKTLRPCGALFYWIPTDTFTIVDTSGSVVPQSYADLSWDDLKIPAEPSNRVFPYVDPVTDEFVWADPSTERFRAWMRSNVGQKFLVKAGEVSDGLPAGDYTITVGKCRPLQADKFIEICTTTWIGTKQAFLAGIFFACASIITIGVIVFLMLARYKRFAI
jgi:hypothetical protein